MKFAPQQDWEYVEGRSRESDADRLRAMSPAERFAVYADLYNVLWRARQSAFGDWDKLEQVRWEEKVDLRRRMVEAFTKLDQRRSG